MASRPAPPDRIVKPRRRHSPHLPIIAVADGRAFVERTGEIVENDLPGLCLREPSSIWACQSAGYIVRDLDEHFKSNLRWQFRATPVERERYRPNREKSRVVIRETVISFFGFQSPGKKKAGHYHYPIDPVPFVRKTIREIWGHELDKLQALFEWGCDVREFLVEQELKLSPTSGGIAGQLLRDPRFYPDPRRKVPKATNAKARPTLPGNYYKLCDAEPDQLYAAAYLDQKSAHHSIAQGLPFPCANTLRGRGYFRTLTDRPWTRSKSPRFARELSRPGLFYGRINVPPELPGQHPPPFLEGGGSRLAYWYSNELSEIRARRGEVEYLIAAWTSDNPETGLNRYAAWSTDTLRGVSSVRRGWLKPTLLSTYGILAARPKPLEFGYRQAKSGLEKSYPIGSGLIPVIARRTSHDVEMPTANVIHRGMIEAETRLRSLKLARELCASGIRILAVYADSVIVEVKRNGKTALPLLPDGWAIESYLTGLRFITATAFTSSEMTRLPGVPKEARNRERISRILRGDSGSPSGRPARIGPSDEPLRGRKGRANATRG